jgi:hypothetical protein
MLFVSHTTLLTSKNLFNHQTWKTPSPISTPSWKIDHHFTLAFVLSAVFLCVRSRTTMYDCSSLTCVRRSDNSRTGCLLVLSQNFRGSIQLDVKGQLTLFLQRISWRVRLGHVYDTMHVERHLFAVCAPVFVAEAICVFPIPLGLKRVVAGGDRFRLMLVVVVGVLDLCWV